MSSFGFTGDLSSNFIDTKPYRSDLLQRRSLGWGETILRELHEILKGHLFLPEGWNGWRIKVGVDHCDFAKVYIIAIPDGDPYATCLVELGERLELANIDNATDLYFEEIRNASLMPRSLIGLRQQPKLVIPQDIKDALLRDLKAPALRDFVEAQSVVSWHEAFRTGSAYLHAPRL